ncbi:MAG: enterochelin esterase [Ktedonobacteraceae bacterium]|nr:enterochelin esterase [Ktedonobacteraceae bacterium]
MTIIEQGLISPRLFALKRELESGNGAALEAFWQEIAERGTPLIEPIGNEERTMLVTFLWRAVEPIKNVVVTGTLAGMLDGWSYAKSQMARLLDTDLWYKSYEVPADVRTTYHLSPNDSLVEIADVEDWGERTATFQVDPLNPRRFFLQADEEGGDEEEVLSVLEMPNAPPQPWITSHPGIPAGQVELQRLRSAILNNERRVWVYTPPGYTAGGTPYDLLILFDGMAYTNEIPTPTILDNLLAEGHLPPLVAVMLCSLDGETRERELACYPPFVEFLTDELLPWLHARYHITTNPARTIIGGSSYGGLAATFAALSRADVFGNVLSQSGSAWWVPDDDTDFEWIARQFMDREQLPIRFYLDVGLLENHNRPSDAGPSQLASTRHLRNVLRARGYEVDYAEFNGSHTYLCWRGTLADGLLALARNP